MKDRLSKFITNEGLTPSLLADEMGVTRSGISHILTGRNNARFDFIQKLLERYPKLNAEWLIMGHGSMYKSSKTQTIDIFSAENVPLSPTTPEKPKILSTVEDKNEKPSEIAPEILPLSVHNKKTVEKIFIIYSDKTFATLMPED